MAIKSVAKEAQEIGLASDMIELGARLQVLQAETSLSYDRLARLYREHLRLKASQTEGSSSAQARVDALEERVRTLEKIVTDEGFDLKRELHRL